MSSTPPAQSQAAAVLAAVLDVTAALPVEDALIVESLAYSTLQSGPEHQAWLASRKPRERRISAEPVTVSRDGAGLAVRLNRPERRNAIDAATRDALLDAFAIADADPALTVVWSGEGPSFCAGGDLDEFGTLSDPVSAHLIRTSRSLGAAVHRLRDRSTVLMHGACAGAGVELPAFAAKVIAEPGTTFLLPELSMGLIPGAGGTVSLPRRIGRDRTEQLARRGTPIDTETALEWGLIDEIRT
ncbi:MAG TPA: enoyl-CoA hydratase/isomerase family protein [Mycobacteriales bacterium]|nr:enoyl-CoA hydratase/isomerase family protein [Mycobacteriales bacterium]